MASPDALDIADLGHLCEIDTSKILTESKTAYRQSVQVLPMIMSSRLSSGM